MDLIKGRGNNGVSISRIILLDAQAAWVQSLMRAIAETGVEVIALQSRSIGWIMRHGRGGREMSRSAPSEGRYVEQVVVVPGIRRFPRLTRAILTRNVRTAGARRRPE